MDRVSTIGESGVIERIRMRFPATRDEVLVGIGDDTATLRLPARPVILTTDTMVEGVHFRCDWSSAEQIAIKTLSSNLSDLASKAAEPAFAMLTLGMPPETPVDWLDGFLDQLQRECGAASVDLVGGDTVQCPQRMITLQLWGYQTTDAPIGNHAACPGDAILVTGTLGDSLGGYRMLKAGTLNERAGFLLERFHAPRARVQEALAIARLIAPTTMTDISDGLARDLPKVCTASGVGARVSGQWLPCSEALLACAGEQAAEWAWEGGEDYELLLTADPRAADTLMRQWDQQACSLTQVGTITKEPGIHWEGDSLTDTKGFDHFSS